MKRLFYAVLAVLICTSTNAQVFTEIKHMDKFDDVVKHEYVKTLFSFSRDDYGMLNLTVEEKGRKPKTYVVFPKDTLGTKENVVNLVDDVYGYQTSYVGFRLENQEMMKEYFFKYNEGLVTKEEWGQKLYGLTFEFVNRTIVNKYTHAYIEEIWWIRDNANNNRVIYER